jgi:dienelactone hydrolase
MPLPARRAVLLAWLAGALAGCAAPASDVVVATTPDGAQERIPTTVGKPDGPGPFPAVVILHDCSGLGPRSSGAPDRWSRELVAAGYAVLIPDSFTTRGWPDGICTDPSPGRADVAPGQRARDAYAALAYARTLPYVDGRRVGLMGGSHGGSTTLAAIAASEAFREALAVDRRGGFKAAVALYPGCGAAFGAWRGRTGVYRPVAPVLILIGEKDDWTPAPPCVRLAASARGAEHPVTIIVYPGAHHAFDSDRPVRFRAARVNANAPGGRGATTGGDAAAWTDSVRRVLEFFGRHLGS